MCYPIENITRIDMCTNISNPLKHFENQRITLTRNNELLCEYRFLGQAKSCLLIKRIHSQSASSKEAMPKGTWGCPIERGVPAGHKMTT